MNAIVEGYMQQHSLTLRESNQRWATVAGRPLSTFEQMKIARPFRYDTQHNSWFRVIKPILSGVPYGYVEIDLCIDLDKSVCPFYINIHTTAAQFNRDKFLGNMPDADRQIRENLHGVDVVKWVLYGDVWEQIDVTRLVDLHTRVHGFRKIRLIEVLDPNGISDDLNY